MPRGSGSSSWTSSRRIHSAQNAARWWRIRRGASARPSARLHDDEIEPQRQPRQRLAIGEHPAIQQAVGGGPHPGPLPMVDGLLRAARSPGSARQRTSMTTRAAGGPGSTATRSSSCRPTWTFRARTVQPAATRCSATRASAASPASLGRRPARLARRIVHRRHPDDRPLTSHVSGPSRDLVLDSAGFEIRSVPAPSGVELTRGSSRSGWCRWPRPRSPTTRPAEDEPGGRTPCRPSRCGSCWKPESTSVTRLAAGIPRCARSSSRSATGSTSSISPRPSSAWTSPSNSSARPSPAATRSCSSARRSRPTSRSAKRRSAPTSPSSTSAGSAACSPTSRPSRSASRCSSSSRPDATPATSTG